MIRIPIEPYWENACRWWVDNNPGGITEFHNWLAEQGAIGFPREEFTSYLEFDDPNQATMFQLKWA